MSADQKTDALQNDLRQAVVENDAARVESLLQGQTLDDDFRIELIGGLIAAGDYAPLVKRLTEEAGDNITTTALVSYLASAARQGHAETAVYFVQKCTAASVPQSECIERIVKNAPPEKIGDVAQKVAATTENPPRALSDFMLFAATAKEYGALGALADAGASMGPHAGIMTLMLLNARAESFGEDAQKPVYLALIDKLLASGCDDVHALDMVLPIIAYKLPDGTADPELMDKFFTAGADPFYLGSEARRFLIKAYTEQDNLPKADQWQAWFDQRQKEYTDRHRQTFDTLFGQDFRVQDLLRTETENGENGLQLAARARRVPELLRAAEKTGDLDMAAMLHENKHKQSLLTLAIDRSDAAALLKPDYWARFNTDITVVLDQRLNDDQKKWIDMDAVAAQIDHHRLQKLAEVWQPQFRLRPRTAG